MTLRIGFDIDDVLYPWYGRAHLACHRSGITGGVVPQTWHPYLEYGCERSLWEDVLESVIRSGWLHRAEPLNAGLWAVHDLRDQIRDGGLPKGSEIIAITARGETFENQGGLRKLVQRQTRGWLEYWGFEFDEVIFSADKGAHELDYLVDDNPGNVRSVIATGGAAWVFDRPWNRGAADAGLPRIDSLNRYVDHIQGDQ